MTVETAKESLRKLMYDFFFPVQLPESFASHRLFGAHGGFQMLPVALLCASS